jgi:hypothetical protein
MRKQSRSAAFLMVAALAAAPIIGGLVGSPVSAQQSEDRTDSEEYTASRADYWEARAAYAARKAATQARKAAGGDDEAAEEFGEGGDEEWGGEWGEEGAPGGGAWGDDGYPTQAQLYALRVCESTDDYTINTGNGYYGAYQFSAVTWWWLGYSGYPHHASPAVQDQAVRDLYAIYGWSPWPACSRYLGFA